MALLSAYKANEGSLAYPRDASFSSYLDTAERDFVRSLAESINSPSPGREATTPRASAGRSTSRIPRSELGVFGAERYFNEKLDNKKSLTPKRDVSGRSKPRHRREKRDDLSERKSSKSSTTRSTSTFKSPTPSLKSDASWNSQLGLLSLPKKAGVGLRIFSGFQCRGSCFDKKSVHTASAHLMSQSPRYPGYGHRKSRLSHQDHFAFPIIDTASPRQYSKNRNVDQDQPRNSIEVFGFHHIGKQDIAENLERKLSILAWDAIPKSSPNAPFSFPFPNSKIKASVTHQKDDDQQDARSDASSDLFEIEHLSGISMGPTSGASDISSCMSMTPTATHCYEPSEASIEWSVVTASAADLSAVSDHDDDRTMTFTGRAITNKKVSPEGGLLMGCRNHKAVDVVENKYHHKIKNNDKGKFEQKGSPDIAPSTPSRRSYALAYA